MVKKIKVSSKNMINIKIKRVITNNRIFNKIIIINKKIRSKLISTDIFGTFRCYHIYQELNNNINKIKKILILENLPQIKKYQ